MTDFSKEELSHAIFTYLIKGIEESILNAPWNQDKPAPLLEGEVEAKYREMILFFDTLRDLMDGFHGKSDFYEFRVIRQIKRLGYLNKIRFIK